MTRTVSAAQANREFSKLLRAVTSGESFIVTSRGKPVATIAPMNAEKGNEREADADFFAFLDELSRRPAQNLPKPSRDDMYD
jgi:prevent-host-death family protein